MSEPRPLRVVLLEDSEDDAQLILHELRRAAFMPTGERVETEPDFCARLDPAPDLILADYHQPQFDALRALKLVRERGLDVPVIVVTGALGDEAAVECLKLGACDYLLKDRLARLGQAVVHALEQKQSRDDKRWTEQALRNSEARLTAILETAVDAIITIDQRGMVESVNPAAERLFGYAVREIRGKNVNILMPPPYQEEHERYLDRYLTTGCKKIIGIGREVVGLKNDGTTFPMELTVSEVQLGDRRIFTGIMRDISTRKIADQQEKRAAEFRGRNVELAHSYQDLNEFASIVSRELEDPLRRIHDYANSLLKDNGDKLDQDGRFKLQMLTNLTEGMGDLIDSLRDFLARERVDFSIRETDLNHVLVEIVDSLRQNIQEHGVEVRVPIALPTVRCDRARIGEVFRELITNAIKFNDKPEKWVEVSFGAESGPQPAEPSGNGDNQQQPQLVLQVRDNGIGISEQHFDEIFKGTGIGLTIVKKIIERHDGRIWVESTHGQGTTFSFTLGSAEGS
jgi:two-component system, LuxR family, sensor kinase FixL